MADVPSRAILGLNLCCRAGCRYGYLRLNVLRRTHRDGRPLEIMDMPLEMPLATCRCGAAVGNRPLRMEQHTRPSPDGSSAGENFTCETTDARVWAVGEEPYRRYLIVNWVPLLSKYEVVWATFDSFCPGEHVYYDRPLATPETKPGGFTVRTKVSKIVRRGPKGKAVPTRCYEVTVDAPAVDRPPAKKCRARTVRASDVVDPKKYPKRKYPKRK